MRGQPEKMSLEPWSKVTATDGRGAKVKRKWVPDNWSCNEKAPPTYEPSCSGSWNEQNTTLGRAEARTTRIVSDCADNAAEVGRPGASDTVKSQYSNFELYIWGTGSQWRTSRRTGAMCLYLPRPTTRRAAAWSTICSRRMTTADVAYHRALRCSSQLG